MAEIIEEYDKIIYSFQPNHRWNERKTLTNLIQRLSVFMFYWVHLVVRIAYDDGHNISRNFLYFLIKKFKHIGYKFGLIAEF